MRYGVKGGTVQGDERSFFGALRVAGHGTGSARSGVDIGCSHKRVGAFCRFGIMGFEIWKQEGRRVR
jgi:hypothetical protein